jgi:hypothetical protein
LASGAGCAPCSITYGDQDWHGYVLGFGYYVHASAANLAGTSRGYRSVSITCQMQFVFGLGSSPEAFDFWAWILIFCFWKVS